VQFHELDGDAFQRAPVELRGGDPHFLQRMRVL
jgi:hypothetical protein